MNTSFAHISSYRPKYTWKMAFNGRCGDISLP